MGLKTKTLVLLLLALTASTAVSGCARPIIVTLHPIEQNDIVRVKGGDSITKDDGTVVKVPKDGWLLSDYYLKEVAKARVAQ